MSHGSLCEALSNLLHSHTCIQLCGQLRMDESPLIHSSRVKKCDTFVMVNNTSVRDFDWHFFTKRDDIGRNMRAEKDGKILYKS